MEALVAAFLEHKETAEGRAEALQRRLDELFNGTPSAPEGGAPA